MALLPIAGGVDDVQDDDGFAAGWLGGEGVGDDVGAVGNGFFVSAGHAAAAPGGCRAENFGGLAEFAVDFAGSGRIACREVGDGLVEVVDCAFRP